MGTSQDGLRVLGLDGFDDAMHLFFRHRRVCFVLQAIDGVTLIVIAHAAHENRHAALGVTLHRSVGLVDAQGRVLNGY